MFGEEPNALWETKLQQVSLQTVNLCTEMPMQPIRLYTMHCAFKAM